MLLAHPYPYLTLMESIATADCGVTNARNQTNPWIRAGKFMGSLQIGKLLVKNKQILFACNLLSVCKFNGDMTSSSSNPLFSDSFHVNKVDDILLWHY